MRGVAEPPDAAPSLELPCALAGSLWLMMFASGFVLMGAAAFWRKRHDPIGVAKRGDWPRLKRG